MLALPAEFASIILPLASLFLKRSWRHAQRLLMGAMLAPGKRTITSALRIMGLAGERHFQNYHRVLNRAVWSSPQASRLLLHLLVAAFVRTGPRRDASAGLKVVRA